MKSQQIEVKKLSEIKPYWRNPRNNDDAVAGVVESIRSFGYVAPIIVDSEMVIIAGHTRYRALQQLGIEEVGVVVADLTPEQARGYRIIDNKTGEKAKWDWEKLEPELRAFVELPNWTVHFPELQLKAIDLDLKPITPIQVEKAVENHATTFQDVVHQREEQIKTYTCPHCGEEFDVPA